MRLENKAMGNSERGDSVPRKRKEIATKSAKRRIATEAHGSLDQVTDWKPRYETQSSQSHRGHGAHRSL
ncbi:hypothetical protein D6779_05610 [Candidatus Parcubacteria bacterium]|nr:MAG: hypothetical protein D6779_05610 [Candidatus Parcubacteria bacterium]